MSRPRQILCEQFYLITRRCTQRQFLLRPDDTTNNAFAYCLAEAAQRFGIEIILPMALSNHHHTVIFDRHGRCPAFLEHFHKMLARCMNSRWGRWENLWTTHAVCVTRLLDLETVMAKLVYTAINPIKDMLVERVWQWPGTNGYRQLMQRKSVVAHRPAHFFNEQGVMPETVTLELVIPPELGERDAVLAELKQRVEAAEQTIRDERAKTGRKVLGRRTVLAQSWKDSPDSFEPRRRLRPRFAGRTEARVRALLEYKAFLANYSDARKSWTAGKPATFPRGTYWLAQFAPVQVASD